MSREQAVRARVREIISTARVRLADEVIACRAAGPDGTDEELRAAMDEALAAGDWKPRPLYDIPVAPWRAVPGGAIKHEGNLIHLRLDADIVPATDLLADEEPDKPETPPERRMRLGMDTNNGRPTGMNAADLMATEFPDIRWIVPGYLTEGLTLLAGAPKIGKSWMALGLALAVAAGEKALGEIDCEPGPVLYLALEDNLRRLQSRLRYMGVTLGPAGLHFETSWPTVDEGCVGRMEQWLDDHDDARLIVVDVFAKIKSAKGGNRPQYEVDYKEVTALQRLALDRGIAIVLVHHTRKAETDGDPFDLVSGTRGLTGSADSTFVLTRAPGQGGAALYGRGRDIEEIEKAVTFDSSTCRWTITGPVVELQASPERQQILEALHRANGPMQLADIAEAVQKSAKTVSNMLGKMVESGSVRKAATGQYEIAPSPARPWSPIP